MSLKMQYLCCTNDSSCCFAYKGASQPTHNLKSPPLKDSGDGGEESAGKREEGQEEKEERRSRETE